MGSLQHFWYLKCLVLHELGHPVADKRDPIDLHQAPPNPRAPPQPSPLLPLFPPPPWRGAAQSHPSPRAAGGGHFPPPLRTPRHLTIGCHHLADAPVATNRRAPRRLLPHRGGGAKRRGGAEERRALLNAVDGATLLACSGVLGTPAPPVRWRLSGGRGRRPPLHQPERARVGGGWRGARSAGGLFVWLLIGMDGQWGGRGRRRTGDARGGEGGRLFSGWLPVWHAAPCSRTRASPFHRRDLLRVGGMLGRAMLKSSFCCLLFRAFSLPCWARSNPHSNVNYTNGGMAEPAPLGRWVTLACPRVAAFLFTFLTPKPLTMEVWKHAGPVPAEQLSMYVFTFQTRLFTESRYKPCLPTNFS